MPPLSSSGEPAEPCWDVAPEILNWSRIKAVQESLYTDDLKERAMGGDARVSLLVDREGRVRAACIARSTGYGRLDDIALAMMGQARFAPPRRDGRPEAGWTTEFVRFAFRALYPPEGLPQKDRVRPLAPCPRVRTPTDAR